MKTQDIHQPGRGGFCVVLMVLLAGCASAGYQKSEKTAATLQSSADRIERAGSQLHLAVVTLNDLVSNPQPDLRPQFKKFSDAMGKAPALTTTVRQADRDLQSRGIAQFDNWDKELAAIQNESIRTRGQARKGEVVAQYDAVRAACAELQREAGPVQSDLKDVHRFLKSDLTPHGIAALKDTITRINRLAAPLNDSANKLAADMRALANAMSPQLVTEK